MAIRGTGVTEGAPGLARLGLSELEQDASGVSLSLLVHADS